VILRLLDGDWVEGVADIAAANISQNSAGYGIDRVLDDVLM
jgi:hypothetical protein